MSLFLSFWGQIKELLKKLEKLSEEVLAVRSENAHLAVQLQVCFPQGSGYSQVEGCGMA